MHLDLGLFVVADGMGGHAAGEVASQTAVDAVAAHVQAVGFDGGIETPPPPRIDGGDAPPSSLQSPQSVPGAVLGSASRVGVLLAAAVQHENEAVREAAVRTGEGDMGTTVAAVLVRGDRAAVAHVGDSRVYRYRDGRLEALTDDHSLLAECLRSGTLTPDLAGAFPYKHLVTRSLGAGDSVDVDTRLLEPVAGDVLLLCSDGLSGVLGDDEIAGALGGKPDLDATARLLVDRANERGGPDNVTVVLVRWLG